MADDAQIGIGLTEGEVFGRVRGLRQQLWPDLPAFGKSKSGEGQLDVLLEYRFLAMLHFSVAVVSGDGGLGGGVKWGGGLLGD